MQRSAALGVDADDEVEWEAAVATIYDRRATHLWDYARRLGLDSGQAEEVAQEAFVKLLALAPADRPRNVDAWLFRVTHNLTMDRHRRRRPEVRVIEIIGAAVVGDVERREVWELVERLPQRQREAVFLRYRADLDFATIAEILRISESGARANAFRGLAQLRRMLVER